MRLKKNILLTFDYEIFFCKYGTVQHSLIIPTEKLIQLIKRESGTFFVDVLFLEFLLRNGCLSDYQKVFDQLREIVSMGHRIELHLHPHWINSMYRIHEFQENEMNNIFERSLDLLNKIASLEDSNYKVTAFRAGGWCIQPFSYLKKTFKRFGLKIDSSVASGMYQKTKYHYFDFRHAPGKDWYRFTDNVEKEEDDGYFMEIPISTFVTNPIEKISKRWIQFIKKDSIVSYGDGCGMSVDKFTLARKLFERKAMFSADGVFDVDKMINKIISYQYDNLTVISHPKNFTNISFQFLESLIESDVKFLTLDKLYKAIGKEP